MRENGKSQISQELLNLARAGDREAMAALYDCTHQEVYRTAHALLRDEDLVLDVQQETYLHAFSHLDQLRDAGSFLPWLRKIAVNEARSQLRKRTPLLFSELNPDEADTVPEPTLRSEDPDADPALHLEQKENARLVREILDELSDGQRMLVAMYYYENVPIKQIAETLQISPGTVKSQLARSRRKVEERVRKLEQEGVKLYGLGPIPFLVALLRNETPVVEAGKRAIPSVALHVGRTFFETALGRVVLGVLAIGVMVGGAAGWKRYQERRNIGDCQPTDTFQIHLHQDSKEDLNTEPATDTAAPTDTDFPEDLIPTTEPLTTAEPVETTEHVVSSDPGNPVNPVPITEHPEEGGELSETPAENTARSEASASVFLRWYWVNHENLGSMDLSDDLNPSISYSLCVEVQGMLTPSVAADVDGVVVLKYLGKPDSYDGIQRYMWEVSYAGSGTVHLNCTLNGQQQASLRIVNPEYPPAFQRADWSFWQTVGDGNTISDKLIGDQDYLSVCVQNADRPRVYTDDPSVLKISEIDYWPGNNWCERDYRWNVKVVGCGSARIYVELGGTVVYSCVVQAPEYPKSILRFQWFYEHETNTYEVGGVNIIDMLVEGNEMPRVYSDRPDIVSLASDSYTSGETGGRIRGYRILAKMLAPGTANIICEYEGGIAYVFQVVVQSTP